MRLLALPVLLFLPLTASALPLTVNHQGRIFDAVGDPVMGAVDVTFRLYPTDVGGTAVWEETQTVDFEDGYYAVDLGSTSAIDPDATRLDGLYLGLAVGVAAELPLRSVLHSVPYAFHALTADAVEGSVTATSLQVNGTTIIEADGTIDFSHLLSVPPVTDTLTDLGCTTAGAIVRFDGNGWACSSDRDTTLTDEEVRAYLENGPLSLATGSTVAGAALVTDWSNLPGLPLGFADGIDNDTLDSLVCTEGQVTKMTEDGWGCAEMGQLVEEWEVEVYVENGPLVLATGSTFAGMDFVTDWSNLPNLPAGFADGVDDDVLAQKACGVGSTIEWTGSSWACGTDADLVLSEADVENLINGGSLDLAGNLDVVRNASSTGNATLGSSSANSHIVNGILDVDYNLFSQGDATLRGDSALGGALTVNGGLNLDHGLVVKGNATLRGASNTLGSSAGNSHTINGNITLVNDLNVTGAVSMPRAVLTSTADASRSTDGALVIGRTNTYNIAMGTYEILARNNGGPAPLYLQSFGGQTLIRGDVDVRADTRVGANHNVHHTVNGSLSLTDTRDASVTQRGAMLVGNAAGENITVDTNEIIARINGGPGSLYLNASGGNVYFGGSVDVGYRAVQCSGPGRVDCDCPAGLSLLSGGVDCDGWGIQESYPRSNLTYRGQCEGGTTQTFLICINADGRSN